MLVAPREKKMKVLNVILLILVWGCSTHSKQKFQIDNFRTLAKNEIDNNEFYATKYVGRQSGCFPDNVTKTCFNFQKNSHELEIVKPLDIKSFGVNVISWGYLGSDEKDLVYLVAAEIAAQLKFEYMIDYYEYSSSKCSDTPTVHTSGAVSGSTYKSSTSVRSNTSCIFSYSVKLIAFNDYDEIKSGVAYNQYGKIAPFVSIYGAGNNLEKFSDLFKLKVEGSSASETKRNAWKKYYDVQKLITETKEKFNLSNESFIYDLKYEKPRSLEKSPRQKSQVLIEE